MSNRSIRIRRVPSKLGGGWNLQCFRDGNLICQKHEPENIDRNGFAFDGKIHYDIAMLACQLDGDSWINAGVRP